MDLPPDLESMQDGSTLKSLQQDAPFPGPVPSIHPVSRSWPRIDGYEIISKLGQGGMGSVFLARDQKLGRQVAIKIVSQIFRNPDGLRGRFDSEIQTLAGLQHTHIAQLYSAGLQGELPYFVMEYVDGPNLEQMAREPMKPALVAQITGKLCDAVGLCHENGILHRDLKPSNILMTQSAQPKIADFGLAKVIGADTSTTKTGEILGTPGYMAPEQASGVVKNLTPACDIYALGAILYRLLTGRPPFASDDPVQTIMMVISAEPVRPRKLLNTIPVELETICLKCLEKNPLRRYVSVAALQDDLQRYLDGRPILARPAGTLEKVIKWAKRNPATAIASTGVVLAMIGTVIGLTLHNNSLARELDRSRRLAEHGSELSTWLIQDHFNRLGTISGTTDTRHRLVEKVKEFLDRSFADMPEDAKYTRRLGYSYASLAGISGGSGQNHLGELADAERYYLKALDLYDLAEKQSADSVQIRKTRAEACLSLIDLYLELQQNEKSDHYFQLAQETIGQLAGNDWETQYLKIQLMDNRVERDAAANRHEQALETLDKIEEFVGTVGLDADQVEVENQKIWIASNRGISFEALGELADAEAAYQHAVDLAGASLKSSPTDALRARRYSSTLVQLGDIQFGQTNSQDALLNYQRALEIISPLAGQDPKNVELAANQAQKFSRVGSVYRYLSEFELAEQNTRRAMEIHQRLEDDGKTSLSMMRNQAIYTLALADILVARGDGGGASKLFETHRSLCNRILESDPQSVIEWNQLAENHFSHGVMLVLQWKGPDDGQTPARETSDYKSIDHQLSESLRYFDLIRQSSGLSFYQERFVEQVKDIRNVFEDSLDQISDGEVESSDDIQPPRP